MKYDNYDESILKKQNNNILNQFKYLVLWEIFKNVWYSNYKFLKTEIFNKYTYVLLTVNKNNHVHFVSVFIISII